MRFNLENESFNNLETVINDFATLNSQFQQQKTEASDKFKVAFKLFMKDFFTLVPSVKRVVWSQYTPYFNDGDSCTFGVNDPKFYNFTEDEEDDDFDPDEDELQNGQWAVESWDLRDSSQYGLTEEEKDLIQFVSKTISDNNDFFEEIFGDHIEITITAEGIETEEYDHD